jgi:hypothetical protein
MDQTELQVFWNVTPCSVIITGISEKHRPLPSRSKSKLKTLDMERVHSSKMQDSYWATQCHIPREDTLHSQYCGNLKSNKLNLFQHSHIKPQGTVYVENCTLQYSQYYQPSFVVGSCELLLHIGLSASGFVPL